MITVSQDVAQNGWRGKYDIRINDRTGKWSETSFQCRTSKAENNFSVKHRVTEMKNKIEARSTTGSDKQNTESKKMKDFQA